MMSMSVAWRLLVEPTVVKTLRRLPSRDRERVDQTIRSLQLQGPYFGDLKKIHGERNVWRRRVGAYRIFFRIRTGDHTVTVFDVERRASKTY